MAGKRKRYRVRPSSSAEIEVALVKGKGTLLRGKVENLSQGGMGIFFDEDRAPSCALKDTVQLRISSPHLREPLFVAAVVSSCDQAKGGRVYGVEFVDWLGLLKQLPPPLDCVFNKRGDWRVEADQERPVEVMVEAPPLQIRALLHDLSPTGISIQVATRLGISFKSRRKVNVSFYLPYCYEKLSFSGEVVHGSLNGPGIRYGIAFSAERTYGFKRNKNLLQHYIHGRRRQAAGLPVE